MGKWISDEKFKLAKHQNGDIATYNLGAYLSYAGSESRIGAETLADAARHALGMRANLALEDNVPGRKFRNSAGETEVDGDVLRADILANLVEA